MIESTGSMGRSATYAEELFVAEIERLKQQDERLRKRLSGALQHLEEAREGLANYAQEVEQLRQEIEVLRLYGNKDCTGMANAELERRRAEPQPGEHKA